VAALEVGFVRGGPRDGSLVVTLVDEPGQRMCAVLKDAEVEEVIHLFARTIGVHAVLSRSIA
jgi:hypothetical protein